MVFEKGKLTVEVLDELGACLLLSDGKYDGLQPVDGVDLDVDFLILHLLLQQGEAVFFHFDLKLIEIDELWP